MMLNKIMGGMLLIQRQRMKCIWMSSRIHLTLQENLSQLITCLEIKEKLMRMKKFTGFMALGFSYIDRKESIHTNLSLC